MQTTMIYCYALYHMTESFCYKTMQFYFRYTIPRALDPLNGNDQPVALDHTYGQKGR